MIEYISVISGVIFYISIVGFSISITLLVFSMYKDIKEIINVLSELDEKDKKLAKVFLSQHEEIKKIKQKIKEVE